MLRNTARFASVLTLYWLASPSSAHDKDRVTEWFKSAAVQGTIETACGVTRESLPIRVLLDQDMLNPESDKFHVLLVAGLDGNEKSSVAAIGDWNWFHGADDAAPLRRRISLGLIPLGNPEGLTKQLGAKNSSGGTPARGYPPRGKAYDDPHNPEAAYLWRYIGMLAPDVVIVVEAGDQFAWRIPQPALDAARGFTEKLVPRRGAEAESLAAALVQSAPAETGRIPAMTVVVNASHRFLEPLGAVLLNAQLVHSPARQAVQRRQARTPVQVAEELSQVYGHQLNEVAYIPALSLIGRLRLAELTGNDSHQNDVQRIVRPYHSGEKPTLGKNAAGSHLAGHLVFGELADRTKDRRYIELAKAVADLGFDSAGQPREAMPHHIEMSDSVFMGTPILAQVGRLTGDAKYFAMALRHLRFMNGVNQRADGLHQHSPVDQEHTAWGRGNGFVTLGMVLALSEIPADRAEYQPMLDLYRQHLQVMLKHQDEMGMWHQVVDHPESYRELTVTCMTAFAMTRGLRRGWLDRDTYEPSIRRAWSSIKTRIGPQGSLIDVCTGTGKMKSLREYFDRPANFGRDDRGGAMCFLIATELAYAEREGILRLATGLSP